MYGSGRTASHPEDAAKFSGEIKKNMPMARQRFVAAMELLPRAQDRTDTWVLALAVLLGAGVSVMFYRLSNRIQGKKGGTLIWGAYTAIVIDLFRDGLMTGGGGGSGCASKKVTGVRSRGNGAAT